MASQQQHNHYDPRRQPASGPSQSSPYASHDGTGPYYAPPAYPCPAPMNRPSAGGGYMPPRASNVSSFKLRQRVSVRITTDTWVMGVIISVVHIYSMLTGGTYLVEFESIDGSGRRERREFTDEQLVPFGPGR